MRRDVFQAIADPTRREIIEVLSTHPLTVNAVAEQFDISRQAVSKHVRILTECRLVTIRVSGRERVCELRPAVLAEVSAWVDRYRVFWNRKLDALDLHLKKTAKKASPKKRSI